MKPLAYPLADATQQCAHCTRLPPTLPLHPPMRHAHFLRLVQNAASAGATPRH